MGIKDLFQRFRDSLSGKPMENKHILNVYYHGGKTYITTFGSCTNFYEAKNLTAKLVNEGAGSPRAGLAIFPRELEEKDFERFNEKYNLDFKKAKYVRDKSREYWKLMDLLKLP